ncbi:methylenetetrahydrofolate reductase C-terminal domain-containing protein [Herbiconiux solani]|uniref:methylenetetrahydrofolate reductase C-terminal domain-containing protein n=1 Tax=Herbiconiux solani TaxID=661329 RepID=UPI00082449D4|nr:methylenetetrahydrofolate reductase C-terminal domain-containing protein [Herbiconiux solani]
MTGPTPTATAEQRAGCPKHMEYGPCGGVEFDGSCEVGDFRCVFLDTPTIRWHGAPRDQPLEAFDRDRVGADPNAAPAASSAEEPGRLDQEVDGATAPSVAPSPRERRQRDRSPGHTARQKLLTRQIVVADFPARALDRRSLADCAEALAGRVDAALAGDSGPSRVQFPPAYRAHLIQEAGLPVWTGLNCRDRNRVALEGEIAALAEVGVAGVHCVTGDHTLTGDRPDAQPVFDLDSTRVAALARAAGHLVSVGESPATPPVARRASRLREKVLAGADLCFVNHAGGAGPVRRFIAEVHATGVAPGFIPCVPMVIDRGSATLLKSFTTLVLPEGFLDGILDAADPRQAGLDEVTRLAEEMLALDGVVGVNLSGGASAGTEVAFAEAMGLVADRLGLAG